MVTLFDGRVGPSKPAQRQIAPHSEEGSEWAGWSDLESSKTTKERPSSASLLPSQSRAKSRLSIKSRTGSSKRRRKTASSSVSSPKTQSRSKKQRAGVLDEPLPACASGAEPSGGAEALSLPESGVNEVTPHKSMVTEARTPKSGCEHRQLRKLTGEAQEQPSVKDSAVVGSEQSFGAKLRELSTEKDQVIRKLRDEKHNLELSITSLERRHQVDLQEQLVKTEKNLRQQYDAKLDEVMQGEFRKQLHAQVKEASKRIRAELVTDYKRRQKKLMEENQELVSELKKVVGQNRAFANEIRRAQQEKEALGIASPGSTTNLARWKEIAQRNKCEADRFKQDASVTHKRVEKLSRELFETTQKLQNLETAQRRREAVLRQEQAALERRVVEVKRHEEHWQRIFRGSEGVLAALPSSPPRNSAETSCVSRSSSLSQRRVAVQKRSRLGKVICTPGSSLMAGGDFD